MPDLRAYPDRHGRPGMPHYLPYRQQGEVLQVKSVVKGGSGETTNAARLARHVALKGHRDPAIDLLDPKASLTALHGIQPEPDNMPSLCQTLRYDAGRRPIRQCL